ncbi:MULTISPECIES: hypothetical protein [Streptomyces]|uniref:Uncharacterized protein n=1 Tax=Streptomyces scabiei TaxID=1930 RepID=A0A117ED21_STRSC|nr:MULTISPECIES: hypothetical protein [Streptomyces]MDX3067677.1 hypothetical protein [Streptomyces sp. ND04-05B]GAQ61431.1 hypothetical protein SsS58_01780 [Streptomyces scabiei]
MNDSLSSESFYRGAKKAAHKAMDDHGRPEYDEFALHAGVAVEKLAKAALAAKNPLYIAEPRNTDTTLYLGGHLQMDEDKVRTIGARDSVVLLRKIGVLQPDSQLDLLIAMRNGAAHAAPDSAKAKGMISPLARTIETLLGDLGKPLDEFWERWTDAVKNAVNEQEDQVFRDVQLRITQAKHAFDDRFAGLRAEVKERALTVPKSALSEWVETVEIKSGSVPVLKASAGDCPACGGRGVLTFEPTHQTGTDTHYSPNGFNCSMCAFRVDGPDEMAALRKANTPAPGTVTSVAVASGAAAPNPTTATIKIGKPKSV